MELDDRIQEIDFGDLEGKNLSEMGEAGILFLSDPFHFAGFPNGETIQDVCARTQAFLKELIARDDGKTYLISTHGCAMRAMVHFLTDHPADFSGRPRALQLLFHHCGSREPETPESPPSIKFSTTRA